MKKIKLELTNAQLTQLFEIAMCYTDVCKAWYTNESDPNFAKMYLSMWRRSYRIKRILRNAIDKTRLTKGEK